ncbi:hypothetical protein QBC46DRAFT_390930 [Diplogelasinospora grovesii]|uniref:Uncharacterized protein n=1 Tax=Diplogelasinospora grovesii TaxID=303347 RepID=A0AAN6S1V9_9PEZI|nr:hypothetical protein QBC46DRAFT_390930 [Diplogelasinospora grovesii]
MDKFAKQANPLRARASRVKKSRRAYRDSRTLLLYFKEKREFEDDNNINKDNELERSYDGFNADYYYELKEEREERKQEKLREQIERTKEEEVRAVYRSFKKAKKERKIALIKPLKGQIFKLFYSDYVDHFYSNLYTTKRVEFYYLNDANNPCLNKQKLSGEADMLYSDVYLDCDANCDFGPFRPPKRASRKAFKVKSCDGKYELSFKFISNGYLKLRISREMVFMNPYSASPRAPLPAAPEMFEFEKEKAERREKMVKARRSPSPRETWFKMNHPIGSWKLGYF